MKVVAVFVICVITCLASSNVWEVVAPSKASSKSRFYVLHDWPNSGGLYSDQSVGSFPASHVSDVMLKTMGILRDDISWSGVRLGNLFKRPKATALFVVDGLTDEVNMTPLSQTSYPVDQTGLTGQIMEDSEVLFSGDNVIQHIDNLFDGQPIAQFISGDKELSSMLSPELSTLSSKKSSDEELKRIATENGLDADCQVVADFISELFSIQSSVEKLSSDSAVTDRVPDVYVFSFTTLKALQSKYGPFSDELHTGLEMVEGTIKQVSDSLVKMYNNDIIVQSLVLQWEYRSLNDVQVEKIRTILKNNLESTAEVDNVMKGLPTITLPYMNSFTRLSVCEQLAETLELEDIHLQADCTKGRSFLKRSTDQTYFEDYENVTYATPGGIVEKRTDNYSAIFLIIFVTVVPLALALFAISWTLWNMDPGRDSIIYRNTDNIPGLNYQ